MIGMKTDNLSIAKFDYLYIINESFNSFIVGFQTFFNTMMNSKSGKTLKKESNDKANQRASKCVHFATSNKYLNFMLLTKSPVYLNPDEYTNLMKSGRVRMRKFSESSGTNKEVFVYCM